MECLQIDWKGIDPTFVRDEFYESIQAPKWIDFTAPEEQIDDHEWFCGRVGCTSEKRCKALVPALMAPQSLKILQDSTNCTISSCASNSTPVAPIVEKGVSTATDKRPRGTVSTSLSNKKLLKGSKVLEHNAQLPAIGEHKRQVVKKLYHDVSENENPNQPYRIPAGVRKGLPAVMAGGVSKRVKVSEHKFAASEPKSCPLFREVPSRAFKEASTHTEQVSNVNAKACKLSETLMKRETIQKNRRGTGSRYAGKDQVSDLSHKSAAAKKQDKILTTHHYFRLPVKDAELTASMAMPAKKVVVPRPSWNISGNQQKPIQRRNLTRKEAEVSNLPATQSLVSDCPMASLDAEQNTKIEGNILMQEPAEDMFVEGNLAFYGPRLKDEEPAQMVVQKNVQRLAFEQGSGNDVHGSAEQYTLNMLAQDILEDKLIADGHKRNDENSVLLAAEDMEHDSRYDAAEVADQMAAEQQPHSREKEELSTFQLCLEDAQSDREDAVQSTLGSFLRNLRLTTAEESLASDPDCRTLQQLEARLVMSSSKDAGSSSEKHLKLEKGKHTLSECLQQPENHATLSPQPVDYANLAVLGDEHCTEKIVEHPKRELPALIKSQFRSQGRKRKSSEMNFKVNCSSKDHKHDHKHDTLKVPTILRSTTCNKQLTTRLPITASTTTLSDACKEQHKKLRTNTGQNFKPFRLRTEERGALRELGLSKKEAELPNPQEMVHHALKMPSFGQPFRPQRSTKKLTVPNEPNFHTSRTRRACTKHVTAVAS